MGIDDKLLAFLLVLGSGSSTAIGAAVVYKADWIKVASKEVLGCSLGLSSGVMFYVSFVEIFQKSVLSFVDSGYEENFAYLYATLCFFGGIVMIRLVDKLVHYLSHEEMHLNNTLEIHKVGERLQDELPSLPSGDDDREEMEEGSNGDNKSKSDKKKKGKDCEEDKVTIPGSWGNRSNCDIDMDLEDGTARLRNPKLMENSATTNSKDCQDDSDEKIHYYSCAVHSIEEEDEEIKNKKLHRMGLFTALAIAIHNFPEGLATFVATLDDPTVGVPLAVAIAIHNIPEGLCVSVPIYYATGDRHRAFMWGVLSGASEVLAAGLGWLVLAYVFDDVIYGILFGLVAGMMVSICLYELLPTARKYDPTDNVVTNSVVAGMAFMSISLIAFQFP